MARKRKRKPTMYVTFRLTDDKPILPETVQRMLDEMPVYSDIVEMRITEDDGPIPTPASLSTAPQ